MLYCSPVLEGKRIVQDDIVKNTAQSKERLDFFEETGEEPLWTSRVFSGMTMFNIGTRFSGNGLIYLDSLVRKWLPVTVNIMFVTMLGFYLLMMALGINPWLSVGGAVGYALSSNLLVSLMAGHNTKILTIGYMGMALAGLYMVLNSKKYLGATLLSIGMGLMVRANHLQILYYFILLGLIISIVELVRAYQEKRLPDFAKTIGLIAIAGIIGALPAAGKAYNIYAHSGPTIRGGNSELSTKKEEDKGGLDRDYAWRWSNGPIESFTMVIPSFMGGSTGEALPKDGNVQKELQKFQLNKQQKEQILGRAPMYVGKQPFLLGTVYVGSAFILLFIFSMFVVKGPIRLWVGIATVFFLILSFGRHFELINGLLFDYLPMFNKFRTPSMALAIPGLLIPFFGLIGLNLALKGELEEAEFKKALKMTLYVAGGIMALLLVYGLTNDWIGPKDSQYQGENSPWGIDGVYEALLADRKSRYMTDWFLSLVMMVGGLGVIWAGYKKKISNVLVYVIIFLILGGDNWRVSKRYLNNDKFENPRDYEKNFVSSAADKSILKDADPNYRVINITRNPWTDGMTCYHHKNIGGHHAAKLQRYQELIEYQLSPQLQKLQGGLRQAGERVLLDPQVSAQMPVYNMLNTKYFILRPNNPMGFATNPSACGNAWFVSEIEQVGSAQDEIQALANFNPNETAIVESEYSEQLYGYSFGKSDDAKIELNEFRPNRITYSSNNTEDGLAVFSEIYYPLGWEAYVDDAPAEIYRVNYLLRAIKIPAGKHEVFMIFKPASYSIGQGISLAGTILLALFAGSMIYFYRKQSQTEESEA
jgi:hypothetical protein